MFALMFGVPAVAIILYLAFIGSEAIDSSHFISGGAQYSTAGKPKEEPVIEPKREREPIPEDISVVIPKDYKYADKITAEDVVEEYKKHQSLTSLKSARFLLENRLHDGGNYPSWMQL